jgi:nucleoside-diphosphate-sugar epimerase
MKLFIAGHTGMVGSALVRRFEREPGVTLVLRTRRELDLTNATAVGSFFAMEKPDTAIIAAAKVGGIQANNTYPAEFLFENLAIAANTIHGAHRAGVKRLLFLGSSCIYPKHAPQPMPEDSLLTGPLEPTNEAYAIAKITGLKLCQYYRRQYGVTFHSAMPTGRGTITIRRIRTCCPRSSGGFMRPARRTGPRWSPGARARRAVNCSTSTTWRRRPPSSSAARIHPTGLTSARGRT